MYFMSEQVLAPNEFLLCNKCAVLFFFFGLKDIFTVVAAKIG